MLDVRGGGKGREAVFKDHHVIAGAGDLRGQLAFARGCQRVLVGRWQEGAVHTVGGKGHPIPGEGIPAHLGGGGDGGDIAGVGKHAVGVGLVVEVEDLAAVGKRGRGNLNH